MDSEAELRHFLALFIHSLLLFLTTYILMTLSDLESDYINSRECCDKLNVWSKSRLFGLCSLCLLPSTGPIWLPAFLALPFAIWYLRRLYKVPPGNSGLYEPTEIRQRLFLRFSIRETIAFLVFHSLAFFGLLFALAATLSLTEEVPWWKIVKFKTLKNSWKNGGSLVLGCLSIAISREKFRKFKTLKNSWKYVFP